MTVLSTIPQLECDALEPFEPHARATVAAFVKCRLLAAIPVAARLVSIDGFNGIGKSTIAGFLAGELGSDRIGLDDYLTKNQGRYLDALRLEALAGAVADACCAGRRLVLEGCLIDLVRERIGAETGFRIYVLRWRRMASNPEALDEAEEHDVLYGERATEELIAEGEADAARFGGTMGAIDRELIRYPRRCEPHRKADLIVKMVRLS